MWEREGNKEGEGWSISEFIATCRDHVVLSRARTHKIVDDIDNHPGYPARMHPGYTKENS